MCWIRSWLLLKLIKKKNSDLNNYSEKPFFQTYCVNFSSSQKSFFVKQIVLIFSLIRTAFLLGILNLKNTKHLKYDKRRTNANSMAF